ncbi:uncharacterized protein AKAW2_40112A [Aspergillus luchuensis]|uniref:Uncharacterized protein n=1 Tax=Aspergillus kawachii TaxID=1069201 RepID=A0A146F4D4_ASPKA|nr:uncharacterized protein AKAW2_40112A [Aspergillus luchuensis]BCR98429.1 hypothetical protein AKAW2_40112A [Aspergillus luchuensis]GAT20659.1 hypothetical protein RIB2604_00801300 [Aspergillus luchuensis]
MFSWVFQHLERKHERRGNFQKAQLYRVRQFSHPPVSELRNSPVWNPVGKYLQACFNLRFCVQREVYLQARHDELYEKLNIDPSAGDTSWSVTEMQALKKALQSMPKAIWNLEREAQRLLIMIYDEPLERMLCAHHKREDWYLSKWLRAECTRSGGCCGRACGCCERQRNEMHPQYKGHCTSMCLCCEKARGCSIMIDNYKNDVMIIDIFQPDFDDARLSYAYSWINAYVVGLDPEI